MQSALPVGKNPLSCKASMAKDSLLTFFTTGDKTMTDIKTPRRRSLLKGAAVAAGAGAMSAPMLATAQTATTLRFQSTWPSKDIFHEYANDFAKKVNDMASGKLKIEVLPAGAVVPAFQLLEAVNKGTLDGGHGVVAYH
jgi:TRAP-type mannitol/chloroaromatic compound transport system substrate-binding protein